MRAITVSVPPALRRLGAALVTALAFAVPAHATFVQGSWDPPYGPPFTDLGWRGTATIFVPPACLTLSGTVLNDGVACPLMNIVDATVEFYSLGDPSLATVETLDFTAAVDVDAIVVGGGLVQGFALASTGSVLSTSPLGITDTEPPEQAYFSLTLYLEPGPVTRARLDWYENNGNPTGGTSSINPIVTIRQFEEPIPVPLPGTAGLALLGLGLGAGLMAARRRR